MVPLLNAGIEFEEIAFLQARIAADVTSCLNYQDFEDYQSPHEYRLKTQLLKLKSQKRRFALPVLIVTHTHLNEQ